MLTALTTAALVALLSRAPLPPQPESVPLVCVRQDHEFMLSQIKTPYVAAHFVPEPEHPVCTAFVREYFDHWPEAAGVFHVFVVSRPRSEVAAWAAQFKDESLMIASDEPGRLAHELKVENLAMPATVVLDASRREVLRRVGSSSHDNMPFAEFADTLNRKDTATAIGHYNLPKGKTVGAPNCLLRDWGPLAVEGYDLVTYHDPGKPIKGRPQLASGFRGVTYHFATAENRRRFTESPEKYLPTYGGWCASAMGDKGTKVAIDPTNFKVKDGRLHLFYRSMFADALKDWNKHEKEWEPAADANWKRLTNEDPVKPRK